MWFEEILFSREGLYGLGTETASGKRVLSIPVTTGVVDHDEYYEIPEQTLQTYRSDPAAATAFADACRRREHDDLLIQKPGWNRGTPRLG